MERFDIDNIGRRMAQQLSFEKCKPMFTNVNRLRSLADGEGL
jgi:hypothetical protein